MRDFFKGVRKHIGKLDAAHLREQYERLAEEIDSFDRIFTAIDRGIVVLDDLGEVTMSNPAASQLLGMDLADARAELASLVGKSSKRELRVSYPDARDLEIQSIPAKVGTIVCIRDITAEKSRTDEELRAGATRAVCDLAAGVAHEIGNPLNAISLNLQMLRRNPADTEAIDICMSQVKRLDGIIRGFLQALRPSRPNLRPGSPADPLKNCLAAYRTRFEERGIQVTLDIPAALPAVALDADQMEQVFFNLVKNALEAMADGGTIGISLGADDNAVTIAFRDSGSGMDSDQLAHLFEPYRTTKAKGTGLGLMITQRIVHAHGGSISVESEPGKGSVFTVHLPRLERRVREISNS